MGIFVRNTAIAVTWTPHSCHAVRLQGSSNGCQVAAAWSGETSGDSLPELVARAVREVGGNDSIYIVAGGSGQGWGMADLNMPRLKSEELRNALEFELRKQTPLPVDKLHWGFRRLPETKRDAKGRQRVRLYFVRGEHWDSWLKALGGLHHVDALLPAPVALDPLLDGASLFLADREGAGFEYRSEEGLRTIAPLSGNAPKELAQALPFPGLLAGVLDQPSYTQEARLGFARAILLAMYGMTDAVTRDHGTLYQLPEHLTAHRNIALKGAAVCLAIYLLCLVVFTIAGSCQYRAAQIRRVETAITQTRKELEAVRKLLDPKDADRAAMLRKELTENMDRRPDFPSVLMDLTQAVKPPAWVSQSLEWKDGAVTLQVQSPSKDLELAARLEASPFIGDVTERLSSFNQSSNAYMQRFDMTVRYDTEDERELARMQREKERRRQEAVEEAARKVADEEKARAAAADEEERAADEEDASQLKPQSPGESPVGGESLVGGEAVQAPAPAEESSPAVDQDGRVEEMAEADQEEL